MTEEQPSGPAPEISDNVTQGLNQIVEQVRFAVSFWPDAPAVHGLRSALTNYDSALAVAPRPSRAEGQADRVQARSRLESAVWTFLDFNPVMSCMGDWERLRWLTEAALAAQLALLAGPGEGA